MKRLVGLIAVIFFLGSSSVQADDAYWHFNFKCGGQHPGIEVEFSDGYEGTMKFKSHLISKVSTFERSKDDYLLTASPEKQFKILISGTRKQGKLFFVSARGDTTLFCEGILDGWKGVGR